MDNIKIIIIIGEYGFVCIIGFIIYIIYNLFVSISDGNLNPDNQRKILVHNLKLSR